MFDEYLKFLVRSPARSWLDGEIKDNRYYLHSMFYLLQQAVTSITIYLCNNEEVLDRLKQGDTIYSPRGTISANRIATNFVHDITVESEQPAAGYTTKPKTWEWFGLADSNGKRTADVIVVDPPPKRNRPDETGTPSSRSQQVAKGGGNPPSPNYSGVKPTADQQKKIDAIKKQGIFVKTNNDKRVPKYSTLINGKRLCGGHCYVGRYCERGKDCAGLHPNKVEELPSEDRKLLCAWVNKSDIKVKWAPGKEPKRRE